MSSTKPPSTKLVESAVVQCLGSGKVAKPKDAPSRKSHAGGRSKQLIDTDDLEIGYRDSTALNKDASFWRLNLGPPVDYGIDLGTRIMHGFRVFKGFKVRRTDFRVIRQAGHLIICLCCSSYSPYSLAHITASRCAAGTGTTYHTRNINKTLLTTLVLASLAISRAPVEGRARGGGG
eukprot:6200996-Pleurochrysis_carterae.AAC.3